MNQLAARPKSSSKPEDFSPEAREKPGLSLISSEHWDSPPDINGANWEIRLLILAPAANDSAPLVGSFKVVDVRRHTRYDAISHAWGMPGPSWLIEIDQRRYYITMSLAQCLTALRDASEDRALWVDAICVNQKNVGERSQQVQFMHHIFTQASCVQVWLGYTSLRCTRVLALVNDLSARDFRGLSARNEEQIRDELEDLHTLISEPEYWDRLWILQELGLARISRINYGNASVSMEDFLRYLKKQTSEDYSKAQVVDWTEKHRTKHHIYRLLWNWTRLLSTSSTGGRSLTMAELIYRFAMARRSKASNSKDRVYGLLGICTALFDEDIMTVKYDNSLADIYTSFAYRTIELTKRLTIFNQAIPAFHAIVGLPSWVPDWSSPYDAYWESQRLRDRQEYRACGNRHYVEAKLGLVGESIPKIRLALAGVVFGTVGSVNTSRVLADCQTATQSQIMSLIRTWYKMGVSTSECDLQSFLPVYPASACVFASTMFRGRWDLRQASFRERQDPKENCEVLVQLMQGETIDLTVLRHGMFALKKALSGSSFLVTTEGDIGLGPVDTQPGDQIAVLCGGKVPYILRKVNDGGMDIYTLVGECYVHKIMNGQAFSDVQGGLQEIVLE